MAPNLLELPPELLVEIAALLPIRALLKLGQTCQLARSIACSNLRTLALGIHPIRTSNKWSAATRSTQCWRPTPALSTSPPPTRTTHPSDRRSSTHQSSSAYLDSSNTVWVRIPNTHEHDYSTLFAFHNALTNSILHRHGSMLQTLSLSLWTLTPTLGAALAQLPALRALSLTIQHDMHAPPVPRSRISLLHTGQRKAWMQLSSTAVWRPRLRALSLENADLGVPELSGLLGETAQCAELALRRCRYVGSEMWRFLSEEWRGGAALRGLVVEECGGLVDGRVFGALERLEGLKYLDLRGCYASDSAFEHWERDGCRIAAFFPPRKQEDGRDMIIEVDPAYK